MNRKVRGSVNSDENNIVQYTYKTDHGYYTAVSLDHDNMEFEDSREKFKPLWDKGAIVQAVLVRALLMCHNGLTAWRVVESYQDNIYWVLLAGNALILLEGLSIILKRGGVEYSWWCPCFLVYLLTTLPGIWLLQLYQNIVYVVSNVAENDTTATGVTIATTTAQLTNATSDVSYTSILSTLAWNSSINSTATPVTLVTNATAYVSNTGNLTTLVWNNSINSAAMPITSATNTLAHVSTTGNLSSLAWNNSMSSTTTPMMNVTTRMPLLQTLLLLGNDTWLIIVQESLVYLLVLGRWALPRGKVDRDFLADMLLEFLAIASDIMELLAIFDEEQVRANRTITYAILTIWSLSFIQFIPILMQKRLFRKTREIKSKAINRACGDKFVEIVVNCMSIFLQDGPFLVLRLYIMITLRLVTYSLVFFVLKNLVTLLLLSYRLAVVICGLPCCYGDKRRYRGHAVGIPQQRSDKDDNSNKGSNGNKGRKGSQANKDGKSGKSDKGGKGGKGDKSDKGGKGDKGSKRNISTKGKHGKRHGSTEK